MLRCGRKDDLDVALLTGQFIIVSFCFPFSITEKWHFG
jgi:hypothetical protein